MFGVAKRLVAWESWELDTWESMFALEDSKGGHLESNCGQSFIWKGGPWVILCLLSSDYIIPVRIYNQSRVKVEQEGRELSYRALMSSSSLTTKESVLGHQRHRKRFWVWDWFWFWVLFFFFWWGGTHWVWFVFFFLLCSVWKSDWINLTTFITFTVRDIAYFTDTEIGWKRNLLTQFEVLDSRHSLFSALWTHPGDISSNRVCVKLYNKVFIPSWPVRLITV